MEKILILASESPRRQELLKKEGLAFVSFPVKVSEFPNENLSLDEQILDIARRKADACLVQFPFKNGQEYLVLTADTLVILDGKTLGKPQDFSQACDYLRSLSNRSHYVKTAICLIEMPSQKLTQHIETTEVFFKKLSEDTIKKYVDSGEPMDKAGAYGIQGMGGSFIENYQGSFENVMGLPTQAFKSIIQKNNWKFQKNL